MIQKEILIDGLKTVVTLRAEDVKFLEKEADFYKINNRTEERFLNDLTLRFKYWKDFAKEIFRKRPKPKLKIGLGCTVNLYSDRIAVTVVKVFSPRKIAVQENKTKCLDYRMGSYEISKELTKKEPDIFTLRKNGRWVLMGDPNGYGCVTLTLGYQAHFIDPSF